jgi:AcrR family transcriptional regulator
MEKKEIQEQRMKGYFIQATKEMLKGEGLKSISVRNIAERAGYSYATMYNYFKDVQELIFLCVKDFQDECEVTVKTHTSHMAPGKERIKAKVLGYINYFLEYPGIFELFYLERMADIERKQPVSSLIYTFLTRLCQPDWDYCMAHGLMSAKEVESRATALNYLVTGMLLTYINRRQPFAYDDFLAVSSAQVEWLMQ